jgi:hypothetical protein
MLCCVGRRRFCNCAEYRLRLLIREQQAQRLRNDYRQQLGLQTEEFESAKSLEMEIITPDGSLTWV